MAPAGGDRPLDDAAAGRYLAHLGIERRPPSREALAELVTAHLDRVPFENVSKLLLAASGDPPGVPSVHRYLTDMETHGLGGTCYVLNPFLGDLLRRLGYEVELRGADMEDPDVHVVNVVRLDGRQWLVDVGYGAPFFGPLPLEAAVPTRIDLGRDSYVLQPRSADGRSRVDHCRDGEVIHGYTVNREARAPGHFRDVVVDSYRPDSSFLTQLRMMRHRPGRSVSLRNTSVRITSGDMEEEHVLPDRQSLAAFVAREFAMDTGPLEEALDLLEERSGPVFSAPRPGPATGGPPRTPPPPG